MKTNKNVLKHSMKNMLLSKAITWIWKRDQEFYRKLRLQNFIAMQPA